MYILVFEVRWLLFINETWIMSQQTKWTFQNKLLLYVSYYWNWYLFEGSYFTFVLIIVKRASFKCLCNFFLQILCIRVKFPLTVIKTIEEDCWHLTIPKIYFYVISTSCHSVFFHFFFLIPLGLVKTNAFNNSTGLGIEHTGRHRIFHFP